MIRTPVRINLNVSLRHPLSRSVCSRSCINRNNANLEYKLSVAGSHQREHDLGVCLAGNNDHIDRIETSNVFIN